MNCRSTTVMKKIFQSGEAVGSVYGHLVFHDSSHLAVAYTDRIDIYNVFFKEANQHHDDGKKDDLHSFKQDCTDESFENGDESDDVDMNLGSEAINSSNEGSESSFWNKYNPIPETNDSDLQQKGLVFRASIPFHGCTLERIDPLKPLGDNEGELTWILVTFSNYSICLVNLNPSGYTYRQLEKNHSVTSPSKRLSLEESWRLMISSHAFISKPIQLNKYDDRFNPPKPRNIPLSCIKTCQVIDEPDKLEENTKEESESDSDDERYPPKNENDVSIAIEPQTNTVAFSIVEHVINIVQFDLPLFERHKGLPKIYPFSETKLPALGNLEVTLIHSLIKSAFVCPIGKPHIQSMSFLPHAANPTLMIMSLPEYFCTALDIYDVDMEKAIVSKRLDTYQNPVKNERILVPNHGPFGGCFLIGMNHITLFRTPPDDPTIVLSMERYVDLSEKPRKYKAFEKTRNRKHTKDKSHPNVTNYDKVILPHCPIVKYKTEQGERLTPLFVGSQAISFQSPIVSYAHIDNERTLLVDLEGRVYFLVTVQRIDTFPSEFRISVVYAGRICQPTSLTYLNSFYFFGSSSSDDSVLFELTHSITLKKPKSKKNDGKKPRKEKVKVELGIDILQKIESNSPTLDIAAMSPYTEFKDYPVDENTRQYYKDFLYLSCGIAKQSRIKQLKPGVITKELIDSQNLGNPALQFDFDQNIKVFPICQDAYAVSTNTYTIPVFNKLSNRFEHLKKNFVQNEPTICVFTFQNLLYQVTPTRIKVYTAEFLHHTQYLVSDLVPTSSSTIIHFSANLDIQHHQLSLYICLDDFTLVRCQVRSASDTEISPKICVSSCSTITPARRIKKMISFFGGCFLLYPRISGMDNHQPLEHYISNITIPTPFSMRSDVSELEKSALISSFNNLPSDICDIETISCGKDNFYLLLTTENGRVMAYDLLHSDFRQEVDPQFEFDLGDSSVYLFKSFNIPNQVCARCGVDTFVLLLTDTFELQLDYLPILLPKGIDPLSIITPDNIVLHPASSSSNKHMRNSFEENYLSARYNFYVVTQDAEVRTLCVDFDVDKKNPLGYKVIERRMPGDALARKIKLSPSGRYLVVMALLYADFKPGPNNKNISTSIIVYRTDTFQEVAQFGPLPGISNDLEVVPSNYTDEEVASGMELPEQFNIFVATTISEKGENNNSFGVIVGYCFREGRGLFRNYTFYSDRPIYALSYINGILISGSDGTLIKSQVQNTPLSLTLDNNDAEIFYKKSTRSKKRSEFRENVTTICFQLCATGCRDVKRETGPIGNNTKSMYCDLVAGDFTVGPMIPRNLAKTFPNLDLVYIRSSAGAVSLDSHKAFTCVGRISPNIIVSADNNNIVWFSFKRTTNIENATENLPENNLRDNETASQERKSFLLDENTNKIMLDATPNVISKIRWPFADYYRLFKRDKLIPMAYQLNHKGPIYAEDERMSVTLVGAQDGSVYAIYTEHDDNLFRSIFLREAIRYTNVFNTELHQ